MRRRGVNYDVGIEFGQRYHSRPVFDPEVTRRELAIIGKDLHCNAVRITGTDPDRLSVAAEQALDLGLEVWLSPQLHDRSPRETLDYILRCAEVAERARQRRSAVVFVLGCELTLFMKGILDNHNSIERFSRPTRLLATVLKLKVLGSHNNRLNAFLAEAATAVRKVFDGPISYASLPIEAVDWTLFDIIGVDHYRAKRNRTTYGRSLQNLFDHGKPVVVTEVGVCAYQGAEDKGPRGFMIADFAVDPPRLNGDYVRDEAMQARELTEMLGELETAGVDGAFVFTFVTPALPHRKQSRMDLDLAGYGLVKSYDDHNGETCPDLPWQPKQSFHAVADYYARSAR
ncbi:abortive infection protein [Nocardia vermiculata]|uniref:Abortive infection protein n=1 Tax=Nocardia vermiculata TaxID=257274 RepID=A0A846Y901_9NOCA|nr:abortive infection protein [Nocardia vermiculata]NKY53229.1 abortive infection protein [Nocardia vermiculata]